MGATESIFYDDEEQPDDDEDQQQPPVQYAPGVRARTRSQGSNSVAAASGRPRRRIIQSRTSDLSGASEASARSSTVDNQQQANMNLQKQAPERTCCLIGKILGLNGSGKKTLIERLEGKEPSFGEEKYPSSRQEKVMAPYRPPPNSPTWSRIIQLQVESATSLCHNDTNGADHSLNKDSISNCDFFVILIDPRQERDHQKTYLADTIHSIMKSLGYQTFNRNEDKKLEASEKDETSTKTSQEEQDIKEGENQQSSVHEIKRPLSLCILRNFRDLMDATNNKNSASLSEISKITMDVIQEYDSSDLSHSESVVLECCDASLLNCYGLMRLHQFIYQAYLQRKHLDFQNLLRKVEDAKVNAKKYPQVAELSYEDYCAKVLQLGKESNASVQQERPAQNGSRRKIVADHKEKHAKESQQIDAKTESWRSRQEVQRKSSPDKAIGNAKSKQTITTASNTRKSYDQKAAKDALEAFLASDSESDDDKVQSTAIADSDSDDEDFFYDETGMRHSPMSKKKVIVPKPSQQNKSDEEEGIKASKISPNESTVASPSVQTKPTHPSVSTGTEDEKSNVETENDNVNAASEHAGGDNTKTGKDVVTHSVGTKRDEEPNSSSYPPSSSSEGIAEKHEDNSENDQMEEKNQSVSTTNTSNTQTKPGKVVPATAEKSDEKENAESPETKETEQKTESAADYDGTPQETSDADKGERADPKSPKSSVDESSKPTTKKNDEDSDDEFFVDNNPSADVESVESSENAMSKNNRKQREGDESEDSDDDFFVGGDSSGKSSTYGDTLKTSKQDGKNAENLDSSKVHDEAPHNQQKQESSKDKEKASEEGIQAIDNNLKQSDTSPSEGQNSVASAPASTTGLSPAALAAIQAAQQQAQILLQQQKTKEANLEEKKLKKKKKEGKDGEKKKKKEKKSKRER